MIIYYINHEGGIHSNNKRYHVVKGMRVKYRSNYNDNAQFSLEMLACYTRVKHSSYSMIYYETVVDRAPDYTVCVQVHKKYMQSIAYKMHCVNYYSDDCA